MKTRTSARLVLRSGREKSLLRRHPWIFSGAVEHLEGTPAPGETLDVNAADGSFLARAAYSPTSQIRGRVWTFAEDEAVDAAFLRARIRRAAASRARLPGLEGADAVRLIYAESDGFPGLIVDRYGDLLVAQFLTCGAEAWREVIAGLLAEIEGIAGVYERSDADVRALEGLSPRCGWLKKTDGAAENGTALTIREDGLRFGVNIQEGHKTGFYLDQRANRALAARLAPGRDVLDGFCYTGGFSMNCLAGGAKSVLALDSSAAALAQARANLALNGLDESRITFQEGDVFHELRALRDRARSFDMIILDPPKFAATAAQAERAARGYKDINLLAFKLLRPGGILMTYSCSGGVSPDLFQKIIAGAALDAGVQAQILARLSQDGDHPVALHFPESEYLKGLVVGIA